MALSARRAAKVDSNHAELVKLWREMGAYVIDCSHVGKGFPDVLLGWRGKWTLIEIKDGAKSPSRRKLTVDQIPLHAECERRGLPLRVIVDRSGALALLGARVSA